MLAELAALRREVADLRALVSRLVCAGEVLENDPAGQRVRVRLPGDDNLTTAWLPVLAHRAKGTRMYSVPQPGEQVWCLFQPDGGLESGAVIGASFNQQDKTPAESADVWRIEFADGGYIAQDAQSGTLQMHAVGPMSITAPVVTVTADVVTVDAPLTHLTGALVVDLGISGGSGAAITGDIEASGNVKGQNDVIAADTVSLVSHRHTGVQSGGDLSGPPEQ